MKFLMVAQDARNSFLMKRVENEGHEVRMLVQDTTNSLVECLTNPEDAIKWGPDVAMFDTPGVGSLAKYFQDNKVHVLGGSLLHDTIHNDPEYIQTLAGRVRVPIFPLEAEKGEEFKNFKLVGFFSKKQLCGPVFAFSYIPAVQSGIVDLEKAKIHAVDVEHPDIRKTFGRLSRLFCAFNFAGPVTLEVSTLAGGSAHIHSLSTQAPEGFWAAWTCGLEGELNKVLHGIASGKRFSIKYTENATCAVKVCIPPYSAKDTPWIPAEDLAKSLGMPKDLYAPALSQSLKESIEFFSSPPPEEGETDMSVYNREFPGYNSRLRNSEPEPPKPKPKTATKKKAKTKSKKKKVVTK